MLPSGSLHDVLFSLAQPRCILDEFTPRAHFDEGLFQKMLDRDGSDQDAVETISIGSNKVLNYDLPILQPNIGTTW